MRRGLIICGCLLVSAALFTAGCTNSGGSPASDEAAGRKYQSAVEKGEAPTGGPLSAPTQGGPGLPAGYPGAEEAGQAAPQGGGPQGQPSGKELENLYKKKGG